MIFRGSSSSSSTATTDIVGGGGWFRRYLRYRLQMSSNIWRTGRDRYPLMPIVLFDLSHDDDAADAMKAFPFPANVYNNNNNSNSNTHHHNSNNVTMTNHNDNDNQKKKKMMIDNNHNNENIGFGNRSILYHRNIDGWKMTDDRTIGGYSKSYGIYFHTQQQYQQFYNHNYNDNDNNKNISSSSSMLSRFKQQLGLLNDDDVNDNNDVATTTTTTAGRSSLLYVNGDDDDGRSCRNNNHNNNNIMNNNIMNNNKESSEIGNNNNPTNVLDNDNNNNNDMNNDNNNDGFIPFLRWYGYTNTSVDFMKSGIVGNHNNNTMMNNPSIMNNNHKTNKKNDHNNKIIQRSGYTAIRSPEFPFDGADLYGMYEAIEIIYRAGPIVQQQSQQQEQEQQQQQDPSSSSSSSVVPPSRLFTCNLHISSYLPDDVFQIDFGYGQLSTIEKRIQHEKQIEQTRWINDSKRTTIPLYLSTTKSQAEEDSVQDTVMNIDKKIQDEHDRKTKEKTTREQQEEEEEVDEDLLVRLGFNKDINIDKMLGPFRRIQLPFNEFRRGGKDGVRGTLGGTGDEDGTKVVIESIGFVLMDEYDGPYIFDLAMIRAINFHYEDEIDMYGNRYGKSTHVFERPPPPSKMKHQQHTAWLWNK